MSEKLEGLSESLEDYLEAILELEHTKRVARVKDIADKLGFQRGSVSGAMKTLDAKGLVNYKPYSFITLTDKGRKIARRVADKHKVICEFLTGVLDVDERIAQETSCRIEHAIDEKSFARLKKLTAYLLTRPKCFEDFMETSN